MVDIPPEQIWMVVVGFLIAFVLAFGIGANDVANSFGTSIGSKVLTLRQACVLASIFETLGAVFLGAKVSDTIRKGIIDISPYTNDTELLMVGNVAALSGSCCWLLAATLLRLPVSATHSIVGATVGFALVAHGTKGIHWEKLGMIIGSWFASPILAGGVSTLIFFFLKYFILNKENPLEPGLRLLPVFYAATIVINIFSVFYDGPSLFGFDKIPLWGTFIISFGSGVICALVVYFFVVPWQRRRIRAECNRDHGLGATQGDDDSVKIALDDSGVDLAISGKSSLSASHNCSEFSSRSQVSAATDGALTMAVVSDVEAGVTNLGQRAAEDAERNKNTIEEVSEKEESLSLMPGACQETSLTSTPKENHHGIEIDCAAARKTNGTVHGVAARSMSSPTNSSARLLAPPTTSQSANGIAPVVVESHLSKHQQDLETGRSAVKDGPETARLFSFLQILTAVFGAFAHGGNDVSNAIGPLVSLWLIATTGEVSSKMSTPVWILLYGGIGISVGLWVWGRRVIKTMGEDLAKITPSSGFCIEIGSALTVLVASNCGVPISTTHCKVGSVVFVGRFRARENVDWLIFRNIVLAWAVTLPVAGGISAALMAGLRLLV